MGSFTDLLWEILPALPGEFGWIPPLPRGLARVLWLHFGGEQGQGGEGERNDWKAPSTSRFRDLLALPSLPPLPGTIAPKTSKPKMTYTNVEEWEIIKDPKTGRTTGVRVKRTAEES